MKRPYLILAAWLLLLVPTLLIGGLALNLLRHEEERIAAAGAAAAAERAASLAERIELAVAQVRDGMLDQLRSLSGAGLPEALERWRDSEPLVRNVFVWDPKGGLLLPRPGSNRSEEEEFFARRYEPLFKGRAAWGTPAPERRALSRGPAAAGAGWVHWFWEDQLHVLGWVNPEPDGRRYGMEVEMAALLSRIAASLPAPSAPGEAYALLDGNGRVFCQTGAVAVGADARPAAAVSAGQALPHWQVAVYRTGQEGPIGTGSFLLLSGLLVGCFVAAIVLGGSLLLWQAYRNGRDAARKTSFVSNVSHELKTPLTTIRMYAELLSEGRIREEDKRRRYLDVIVAESERLTRLVNNVLDFSRLEQGRKKYAIEEIDLGAALRAVLDAQAGRFQGINMVLTRRIPEGGPAVRADRDALEQAVLNLLDNAAKYAQEGGELTVEAEAETESCRVRVLDRGPGIPPEHRSRIFEKFHRVDDSLTARQPGSGLGLSIARQLMRDMGGDLTYRPRDGGGACFEIRLPIQKERNR